MGTGTGIALVTLLIFLASRGKEEVPENGEGEAPPEGNGQPSSKVIEFDKVDVLSINDIPFVEVGVDIDGMKYGILQHQITQDNLFVKVSFRNKTQTLYSDDNARDFYLFSCYNQYGGPNYEGRAGVTLYKAPEGYYSLRTPPFNFSITPRSPIVAGSYEEKLYSCEFKLGLLPYDYQMTGYGPIIAPFRVKDFLNCTGSGYANI